MCSRPAAAGALRPTRPVERDGQGHGEGGDAGEEHDGPLQTEQRRRRLVYLRDAAQRVRMEKPMLKGFGWLLVPFAIIPIFWPFFIIVWILKKKVSSRMETQLQNALEYWGIHEVEVDEYISDDLSDSDDLIPDL